MNDQATFTNEELTGYLDGAIADELAECIRVAISQDAQLALRVDRLRLNTDHVKVAVDTLLESAPAAPATLSEKPQVSRPAKFASIQSMIAASLVFLLLGGALGAHLASNREETWQDIAASYHALYVNSTLSHVKPAQSEQRAELKRVSDALVKSLKLSVVSDVQQLDYKRAQILGYDGQPIAQLAFLSKIGAPVALCIKRVGHPSLQETRPSTMRGMSAVTWSKGNYEFLLVGGRDTELLTNAAATFVKNL